MIPESAALTNRYSIGRALKRWEPTKEGPPVLDGGAAPVNRASLPDWEESVPNPAQRGDSSLSLNDALMTLRGRAVSDSVRLEHIIERQPLGNSLRRDAQRSRRKQSDLAMPEARWAAAVVDHGQGPRLVDRVFLAALLPLL